MPLPPVTQRSDADLIEELKRLNRVRSEVVQVGDDHGFEPETHRIDTAIEGIKTELERRRTHKNQP